MLKKKDFEAKLPKHVAIIMDGNRRWAAGKGLGAVEGHRYAAKETIKPIVKHAIEIGIPYLTFWAFSSENRNRDKEELHGLFNIFKEALKTNLRELEEMGVRIQIIGDVEWFPKDIAQAAKAFVESTKNNTKITVSFALNYGGREEILRAISRLLDKIQTHKRTAEEPITEKEFSGYLDTSGIPDPDLVIRTGGNVRLSGYFPWQTVYSELYFTKTLWPDFTPEELEKALLDYLNRVRRFGKGSFKDYLRRKAQGVLLR